MNKNLIRTFQGKLEMTQVVIKKFQNAINEEHNISYTLSWSQEVFRAAAAKEVFSEILRVLINNQSETLDLNYKLEDFVKERLITLAKSPKFSTSTTSNLIETFTLAAWADALDTINFSKQSE